MGEKKNSDCGNLFAIHGLLTVFTSSKTGILFTPFSLYGNSAFFLFSSKRSVKRLTIEVSCFKFKNIPIKVNETTKTINLYLSVVILLKRRKRNGVKPPMSAKKTGTGIGKPKCSICN